MSANVPRLRRLVLALGMATLLNACRQGAGAPDKGTATVRAAVEQPFAWKNVSAIGLHSGSAAAARTVAVPLSGAPAP